jgi:uncharacterized repeat protein (TIGR01451 family)
MRKFFKLLIILLFFGGSKMQAQTTLDILYMSDSASAFVNCNYPYLCDFSFWGNSSGYAPLDSLDVEVSFDDGTDTTFRIGFYSSGTSFFWGQAPHTYNLPGTYTPRVVVIGPDANTDTAYSNPVVIHSSCVLIDGRTYQDNNANCIFDTGDDTLQNIPIRIDDGAGNTLGWAYSDANGYYTTSIAPGFSTANISIYSDWWTVLYSTTCPGTGSYSVPAAGGSFDFALDCGSSTTDYFAGVGSLLTGAPGSSGHITVYGGSSSCFATTATFTVVIDPQLVYTGMIDGPLPTTVSGNTLTWNLAFTANTPYVTFVATIGTQTPTTATLFNPVDFNVTIAPAADVHPTNNGGLYQDFIGGPYDPNNKLAYPAEGAIQPETEITYTINFQNTGTAPAINVYLLDQISDNLDHSSIQIIGSSHEVRTTFYDTGLLRFDFDSINLPDSTTDEPGSHGWVVYKIKAKEGLAEGTQIMNTAGIYFDYNAPIITNTTVHTIDMEAGIAESKNLNMLHAYPNPSDDNVSILFGKPFSGNLLLCDLQGRTVYVLSLNEASKADISTADLPDGMYLVSLSDGSRCRIVVMH